jgi:hypothetical protein
MVELRIVVTPEVVINGSVSVTLTPQLVLTV